MRQYNLTAAMQFQNQLTDMCDRSAVIALHRALQCCNPSTLIHNRDRKKFASSCPVDLYAIYRSIVHTFRYAQNEPSGTTSPISEDMCINNSEVEDLLEQVDIIQVRSLVQIFLHNIIVLSDNTEICIDLHFYAQLFLSFIQNTTDIENILEGKVAERSDQIGEDIDYW